VKEIFISALNQFCYCPYRFYLMFVENLFLENEYTVAGSLHHESVAESEILREEGRVLYRHVPLKSKRLGILGIADTVEITPQGKVIIVEHKEGRKGRWFNDRVQLCAQALCLEEMTGLTVKEGFIFYRRSRRRERVVFTPGLRRETEEVVQEARRILEGAERPVPLPGPRCRGCSLEPFCLPEIHQKLLFEDLSWESVT